MDKHRERGAPPPAWPRGFLEEIRTSANDLLPAYQSCGAKTRRRPPMERSSEPAEMSLHCGSLAPLATWRLDARGLSNGAISELFARSPSTEAGSPSPHPDPRTNGDVKSPSTDLDPGLDFDLNRVSPASVCDTLGPLTPFEPVQRWPPKLGRPPPRVRVFAPQSSAGTRPSILHAAAEGPHRGDPPCSNLRARDTLGVIVVVTTGGSSRRTGGKWGPTWLPKRAYADQQAHPRAARACVTNSLELDLRPTTHCPLIASRPGQLEASSRRLHGRWWSARPPAGRPDRFRVKSSDRRRDRWGERGVGAVLSGGAQWHAATAGFAPWCHGSVTESGVPRSSGWRKRPAVSHAPPPELDCKLRQSGRVP